VDESDTWLLCLPTGKIQIVTQFILVFPYLIHIETFLTTKTIMPYHVIYAILYTSLKNKKVNVTRLLNILYIYFMDCVSWCWVVINEMAPCQTFLECHVITEWPLKLGCPKPVFLNLLGFKSRLTTKFLYYCPGHNFLVQVMSVLNIFSTTKY